MTDIDNPFLHLTDMNDAMEYHRKREPLINAKMLTLVEADPALPYISAYVMAGDLVRADEVIDLLRDGKVTWDQAQTMVGSYGRMDLRARAYTEALIDVEQAIEDLPAVWRGADPDDTDPRFLGLWRMAWKANRYQTVRDRKGSRITCLRGTGSLVRIYRGV